MARILEFSLASQHRTWLGLGDRVSVPQQGPEGGAVLPVGVATDLRSLVPGDGTTPTPTLHNREISGRRQRGRMLGQVGVADAKMICRKAKSEEVERTSTAMMASRLDELRTGSKPSRAEDRSVTSAAHGRKQRSATVGPSALDLGQVRRPHPPLGRQSRDDPDIAR